MQDSLLKFQAEIECWKSVAFKDIESEKEYEFPNYMYRYLW